MKRFILFGSFILVTAMFIAAVAFTYKKKAIPANHVEVVLRDIGHQLLLSAKDSSSRVLPVKKIDDYTYQIFFQNDVGFISDTLMNIVERAFQKNALAKDYIVNLRNCAQQETVLAFEMNNTTGSLTPCRGRKLETGCYFIEIDLLQKNTVNYFWLLLLIIPLGVVGFYANNKFYKKEPQSPIVEEKDYIPLGKYRFYAADNLLKIEDQTITLSDKETKALKIFAENSNQIVERERLMKEIWEDEGIVVISRNVDVLVSKLRKKLSDDDSLKIINIHGRGYKFMME